MCVNFGDTDPSAAWHPYHHTGRQPEQESAIPAPAPQGLPLQVLDTGRVLTLPGPGPTPAGMCPILTTVMASALCGLPRGPQGLKQEHKQAL